MKISIGTASSSIEFEEDMRLIKSSLLYADEIELIGMAEYSIFNYLPKCLRNVKDIEQIFNNLIPFFKAFQNDDTMKMAVQLEELKSQIMPYMPYMKKKKCRNKQEILAQIQLHNIERQCNEFLDNACNEILHNHGTNELRTLIDRQIVSVYDYSYNGFSLDELTGGYFANLLGVIKHGNSYPLFDNICTEVVRSVIDNKLIDFSNVKKEVLRHAGVANNILKTLPTFEKASIDEILDFKKDMQIPLSNFRKAMYGFSEQISSMPWDDDFNYECIKIYNTEVVPRVNEINELSSETNVLKNFGRRVLEDEEERRKLGYMGVGLITAITTGSSMLNAINFLENILRTGAKIGLTATGVAAFLKTADMLVKAHEDIKDKKKEMEGNVMYYYYKAYNEI